MIRAKSIYKPKEDEDGTRILITRFYPRGVRKDHFDQWLRELAPSKDLLKGYKAGTINEKQFTAMFLDQIKASEESQNTIRALCEISRNTNVTLLCYERDGDFCHRHILHDIISNQMASQEMLARPF